MTEPFDRRLAGWLDRDAAGRVPDHLAEVLVATRVTRQRPAWSSLERWLPMAIPLRIRTAPTMSSLLLLIIAAILVSILGLAIAGRQGPRFPPYGPARNGPALQEVSGDIVRVDPVTGEQAILINGQTTDYAPWNSPDGSRFAFGRDLAAGTYLMVADASGMNVRTVAGPLVDFDSLGWSGDSRYLALIHGAGTARALTVHDVINGTQRRLDLGGLVPSTVQWLPPSGEEIVFRGQGRSLDSTAIFAIRPDGSGLHALTPGGHNDSAYAGPIVSPDGRRVAYSQWEEGRISRTHIRDLATGTDLVLPDLSPTTHPAPIAWSPDATLLLVNVNTLEGPAPSTGIGQLYLFPSDLSTVGRAIGPTFALDPAGNGSLIGAAFSPDGTEVYMVHNSDRKLWTLPVAGGDATITEYQSDWLPSVERLAP